MDYLYYLGNATLVMRVIKRLRGNDRFPTNFVTIIHQLDGWILRVQTALDWGEEEHRDFRAYLYELGVPYSPSVRVRNVLDALEDGCSPVEVMGKYRVAVIAHGVPDLTEIHAFREQFIEGLGYCPETLA